MQQPLDRTITRSILPCETFHSAACFDRSLPAPAEWVESVVPRAMGCAADILGQKILSTRRLFDTSIDESIDRIRLCLAIDLDGGVQNLQVYVADNSPDCESKWALAGYLFPSQMDGQVYYECLDIAASAARKLLEPAQECRGNLVTYIASWSDISNHERFALEEKSRAPREILISSL
jgi:hypothetical protein